MRALEAQAIIDEAIRGRRTHKVFQPEPLSRELISEVLDLARWAPNHKLRNPWRFRVIGPRAKERLGRVAEADKPGSAAKLDRTPTIICATAILEGDDRQRREDLLASAAACYIVLLAAHARGLASYWRTVLVMDSADGRQALGIPAEETPLGLLHLGFPRQTQRVPERAPLQDVVSFLD